MENVKLNDGFKQVAIWTGTVVGVEAASSFEEFMKTELEVRVQYLEEVLTNPDKGEPGTGGRNDLIFAVHTEDLAKFAVKRFGLVDPPSWIDDAYGNGRGYLYDERIAGYKCWKPEPIPVNEILESLR